MMASRKARWETRRTDAVVRKPQVNLRFATINVGSLVARGAEVVETMGRRRVDIVAMQEVRYKNEGTKILRGGDFEYKLFWKGEETGQGGVAIMIRKELAKNVIEVKRITSRIMLMDLVFNGRIVSVISVYCPQIGRSDAEKNDFYDNLNAEVMGKNGNCIVLGDFNGHVGSSQDGYEGVHGGYGYGERNRAGERVLEFADSFDMIIGNTFFKKENEKLITFKSGGNSTVLDYVLLGRNERKNIKDIKVIPGEECFLQHRMLVMDMWWPQETNKAPITRKQVKLWRLKDENVKDRMEEKIALSNINEIREWDKWCEGIMKVAKKVCGVTSAHRRKKTTWWWNSQLAKVIKEKRALYKIWQKEKNATSKQEYCLKKKEVKRVIAAAKEEENKKMLEKLPSRQADAIKQILKRSRQENKDKRDIEGIPCIRDKDGNLRVSVDERIGVWKNYMENLLNVENEWSGELNETGIYAGPCENVTTNSVENALGRMKSAKAAGPSGVTADLLKFLAEDSVERLADVANDMLSGLKMPDSWRKSVLIPLYKGKGDARTCGNYRSIKLLEHGMKVIERIFEERLRKTIVLDEMQMGFMPGKGTIDAIFSVRQMMEKYEAAGRKLYMVFVDLEKAFDRVPRKVIWWALRRKGVIEREIQAIIDMYDGVRTAVKLEDDRSDWFEVKVGVHQGSVLSPLLFAVVLDEITKDVREGIPKEFLYADDLVLIGESWTEVEERYAKWKIALKEKGLKINVSKTKAFCTGEEIITPSQKYPCSVCGRRVGSNSIKCGVCTKWVHKRCTGIQGSLKGIKNFKCKRCCGIRKRTIAEKVNLAGDDLEIKGRFCYLGDVLSTDGGVDASVIARTRAGWKKFKELSGVLCKRGMSNKMKGTIYKICVRSAICYGAQCWAMKSENIRKMEATEMRMLRMICRKTLKDKIKNESIREMTGVVKLGDFIRSQRLRWYGHVMRMSQEKAPVKARNLKISGSKKGRPKKRWKEVIANDIKERGLEDVDPSDREKWRKGCRNRRTPACGDEFRIS